MGHGYQRARSIWPGIGSIALVRRCFSRRRHHDAQSAVSEPDHHGRQDDAPRAARDYCAYDRRHTVRSRTVPMCSTIKLLQARWMRKACSLTFLRRCVVDGSASTRKGHRLRPTRVAKTRSNLPPISRSTFQRSSPRATKWAASSRVCGLVLLQRPYFLSTC